MRPAGWKVFGHAMFKLSQLNVTEVAEFVQRNFQNLFIMAAPPGKQIQNLFIRLGIPPSSIQYTWPWSLLSRYEMALPMVGPRSGHRRRSKWKAGVRKSPLLLQFLPRNGLRFESEPLSRQRSRSSVEPIEPAATMTRVAVVLPETRWLEVN